MKIAIIGAGIYGCHLAIKLSGCGHKIDMYDMAADIFSGASTNNSFRIHKGYHYPRSAKTREMCMRDEIQFCKIYEHLIDHADNNKKIFCIADDDKTLIDFNTMKIIITGAGLNYKELTIPELEKLGFRNVEGGFRVNEAIFMVDKAKKWFKETLINKGINFYFNCRIDDLDRTDQNEIGINGNKYDYVLNCTYNQTLQYTSKYKQHFDVCFYLVVASKTCKALCSIESFGIFDGPYPSLEPYGYENIPERYGKYVDRKIFQVFHVIHTVVGKYKDIEKARYIKEIGLSEIHVKKITRKILEHMIKFYPNFHNEFDVIDHRLELRTKIPYSCDARPLIVEVDSKRNTKLIQVVSSKLTSIFDAEDMLMKILGARSKLNESTKTARGMYAN